MNRMSNSSKIVLADSPMVKVVIEALNHTGSSFCRYQECVHRSLLQGWRSSMVTTWCLTEFSEWRHRSPLHQRNSWAKRGTSLISRLPPQGQNSREYYLVYYDHHQVIIQNQFPGHWR